MTRTRTAGRCLLWGMLSFAAVQLGLVAMIRGDWLIVEDPPFARKLGIFRASGYAKDRDPQTRRILGIGTSRLLIGWNAAQTESRLRSELGQPVRTFNFGIPAAGPVMQNLITRRLLRQDVRADVVILEVMMPFYLAPVQVMDRFGRNGAFESAWLLPHRLSAEETRELEQRGIISHRASQLGQGMPTYDYRTPLLGYLAPAMQTACDPTDMTPYTDAHGWVRSVFRDLTPQQYQHGVRNAQKMYGEVCRSRELDDRMLVFLDETLARLQAAGMKPMLVAMPEGRDFRSWYQPDALTEFAQKMQQLSQTHSVSFVDAREWLPDAMFSDSHHLTEAGADAFSQRLTPMIRTLLAEMHR
ncbi:hypothetical protein [Tuwongella immobilis]|uniref:SGNH/GDSL hydrolase family protein n=1 Tax=Tuwongella immobilis TaxID=692036 RepID=A0A6C2YVL4_9BACT|nr:hypothetical protein [Tuwongella immobilis]VIP05660.1 Uncharacterized protein OS=Singulisphaera acidiphila (strain ATCC BAA-1392 / DSM 18658 / VKM B-2454 / MOB10) GN=Sinac_5817 PE=4 SV=1 [Tuwongella immobilis]VTS08676.1 Uncharacterized protein OS=Singulisphaera acidiphila (strain ATCC BAA-1392 / DSM 18658 / VKM B-2454 / MOB10) GN=Sinac_5817 PE=4 SV=1 [Tuwongella immobilis]